MEKLSPKDIQGYWRVRRAMGEYGIKEEKLSNWLNDRAMVEVTAEGYYEPALCVNISDAAMFMFMFMFSRICLRT